MDSLIDLNKCREYMTVNIGGRDHQIRLSGTIEDPYFCGKDVCKVLGYSNSQDAIFKHVKSKHKKALENLRSNLPNEVPQETHCTSLGSNEPLTYNEGKAVYINEPGLYSLIMNSNATFAEEFQDIVYETILPSIRKYGSYQAETRLSCAMKQLVIKEDQLKQEKERVIKAERDAEEQKLQKEKVEREAKEKLKCALKFNQATKQIEP
jgi:prophage antirepressor-like protein